MTWLIILKDGGRVECIAPFTVGDLALWANGTQLLASDIESIIPKP